MGNMYGTWDRMDADKRKTILSDADSVLAKLDAGEVV
jgi:deoxyribodipyrimidine photolyase-related protein